MVVEKSMNKNSNKKYFIFSDLHARNLSLFKKRLKESGFEEDNSNHILVSLGDLFDRGDDSYNILLFINSYLKNNRAIVLWGNHETMLASFLYSSFKNFSSVLFSNGTINTIDSFLRGILKDEYEKTFKKDSSLAQSYKLFYKTGILINNEKLYTLLMEIRHNKELIYYFNHLLPYYVINDKFLICHSGLTLKKDYKEYSDEWNRFDFNVEDYINKTMIEKEVWGLIIPIFNLKKDENIPFNKFNYEKVIHGHLNVHHFNSDDPFNIYFGKDNIDLDSPYYINILVINEDNSFYFNEFKDKKKIKEYSEKYKDAYNYRVLKEKLYNAKGVIYKNKRYNIDSIGRFSKNVKTKEYFFSLGLYNPVDNEYLEDIKSLKCEIIE